jgi:hypothetical protein
MWQDDEADEAGFACAAQPLMEAVSAAYGGGMPVFISTGCNAFVFSLGDERVCKLTRMADEAMLAHWMRAQGLHLHGMPDVEPLQAFRIDGATAWAMVRTDLRDWGCAHAQWDPAYLCLLAAEECRPMPPEALSAFSALDRMRVACIASTLVELHAHGIRLEDVSPDNVGVDQDGVLMLRDWGAIHYSEAFRKSVSFPDADPSIPCLELSASGCRLP